MQEAWDCAATWPELTAKNDSTAKLFPRECQGFRTHLSFNLFETVGVDFGRHLTVVNLRRPVDRLVSHFFFLLHEYGWVGGWVSSGSLAAGSSSGSQLPAAAAPVVPAATLRCACTAWPARACGLHCSSSRCQQQSPRIPCVSPTRVSLPPAPLQALRAWRHV